jgi:hypothetical protein
MLPFGVTIPDTVPQWSDIPERLMNKPVLGNKNTLNNFKDKQPERYSTRFFYISSFSNLR